MTTQATGTDRAFDEAKTTVTPSNAPKIPDHAKPPMQLDDPANMTELTVLTPEEEAAQQQEVEALAAKAKWTIRSKVLVGLTFVGIILVMFALAILTWGSDTVTTTSLPSKSTAPAAAKDSVAAPTEKHDGKRVKAVVIAVAAMDFASCKHFDVTTLEDGSKRTVGTDCAPVSGVPAKAAAPATTETAPAAIVETVAEPAAPAPAPKLTVDQKKVAELVEKVTQGALEEINGASEAPREGEIEPSELESAEPTPSAK